MKIAAINSYNSNVNFTGINISKLTEFLPDTKVSKGLTQLDKNFFQTYIEMPKYKINITPQEIDKLSEFEGEEFFTKSYELLTQKLGLPDSILPPLIKADLSGKGNAFMAYLPVNNIIALDPKRLAGQKKIDIFSLLRHELQHFNQNLQIFRHEEIGKKAIDTLTEKFIEQEKNTLKILSSQFSQDQMLELVKANGGDTDYIKTYFKLSEANDKKGLDNLFNRAGEQYKEQVTDLRNKIISAAGEIKKDSSLTPKIQAIYDEFNTIGYFNPDGSLDYLKYFNSGIEKDAIMAQTMAGFQFSKEGCFMKFAKAQFNEGTNTKEVQELLETIK